MILLILSILLSYILLPIGFIYSFFKLIFKGGFRKQCVMIAVSIDQLNNKVCKELFNDTLITKDGYGFGKVDETISSALGRNILILFLLVNKYSLNKYSFLIYRL